MRIAKIFPRDNYILVCLPVGEGGGGTTFFKTILPSEFDKFEFFNLGPTLHPPSPPDMGNDNDVIYDITAK